MMDSRAAKLAIARQKLKSHQEKKSVTAQNDDNIEEKSQPVSETVDIGFSCTGNQKADCEETLNKNENSNSQETNLNVTEILISNKRNLEMQVADLQTKLLKMEDNYTVAVNNNNYCKQQICNLEQEYKLLKEKYKLATEEMQTKAQTIAELMNQKSVVCDENNNLQEQLEFTKNMLNAKEAENISLQRQVNELQHQFDATQLQLQQLTNGLQGALPPSDQQAEIENLTQPLLQKISNLEHQLKSLQKEKDQINYHYEHYVAELNEQLKSTVTKNNDLVSEIQNLSTRENSLIEQISELEIRLQQMKQKPIQIEHKNDVQKDKTDVQEDKIDNNKLNSELKELLEKNENLQAQLQEISVKYKDVLSKYAESEDKLTKLSETKESECNHDTISLSKLNADIASDKIAAQRATEQNKKLKTDLQELEEAFVKISRDKLELTEKVAAEKYLNRELTIKLAEVEEKAKDMYTKLLAKDDEMIRLQNSYRDIEKKFQNITHNSNNTISNKIENAEEHNQCTDHTHEDNNGENNYHIHCKEDEHHCLFDKSPSEHSLKIPKEDAMVRLQERFLKIMDDVADLSDEKHRLEHIILQLQNETDTICEYVALYQQQRSLLKKRDEERSAQIKLFQAECDQLKRQLEELSGIIIRLAQDSELAAFFQIEPRRADLAKVMSLLSNLKSNTLIDPHRAHTDLKNFYPCSCCSGQLIDV